MRTLAVGLVLWFPGVAVANGFVVTDLTAVSVDTDGLKGGAYTAQATSADRLTVHCTDCSGLVAIDVLLGDVHRRHRAALPLGRDHHRDDAGDVQGEVAIL